MAIIKVWLDETTDECISCGNCEAVAPMVFEVPDKMIVITGVDFTLYENEIKEAVDICPTGVIKIEQDS
jgi:ferredoxin